MLQGEIMNYLKQKKILFAIILLSLVLRLTAACILGNSVENLPGTFDQISYHTLAQRVLNGHGFHFGEDWWPMTEANTPTAHWSFLYTFYLTLVYALVGPHPLAARLLQAAIVGILHPLLTYFVGRQLLGETVGLIAAAISAVYIYFVYYAATLMTEPFYITAILAVILLSLLLINRIKMHTPGTTPYGILRLASAFGLLLGITILLRQLFLLLTPLLFLWIFWLLRKNFRLALHSLTLAALVIVVIIVPFTIYNYIRFDSFVLLNTNAGYAFYFANHPIYGTHFEAILPPEMGSYQDLVPDNLRQLNEAALDKALLKQGIQYVIEDPVRYLILSASRLPAFFMFWPSSESVLISNISRVGSFGLFLPFMLYGTVIAVFSSKYKFGLTSPIFLVLAFGLAYTAIHIFSWALIRYRLPIDAVMVIFAGLAFANLYQHAPTWIKRLMPPLGANSQSNPASQS